MLCKKAQIAETMTWVVATILIVIILLASAFVVGIGDKSRKINNKNSYDVLVTKSFIGYLKTKQGEKIIYEKIKNDLQLESKELCDFSKKFSDLYKKEDKETFYIYHNALIISSNLRGAIHTKCFETGAASQRDFLGSLQGFEISVNLDNKNKVNMRLTQK